MSTVGETSQSDWITAIRARRTGGFHKETRWRAKDCPAGLQLEVFVFFEFFDCSQFVQFSSVRRFHTRIDKLAGHSLACCSVNVRSLFGGQRTGFRHLPRNRLFRRGHMRRLHFATRRETTAVRFTLLFTAQIFANSSLPDTATAATDTQTIRPRGITFVSTADIIKTQITASTRNSVDRAAIPLRSFRFA